MQEKHPGREKDLVMATKKKALKSRRYGKTASEKVARAMHKLKRGTLRSGRSNKKVRDRKQAIAIGLSEARRAGGKVPPERDAPARGSEQAAGRLAQQERT